MLVEMGCLQPPGIGIKKTKGRKKENKHASIQTYLAWGGKKSAWRSCSPSHLSLLR